MVLQMLGKKSETDARIVVRCVAECSMLGFGDLCHL